MKKSKTFHDKLDAATDKKECGVYLYDGFLSSGEARKAFDIFDDDSKFPWDTKPVLFGETLTSHAYEHDRYQFRKKKVRRALTSNERGLFKLEELCSKIERDFDVKISYVFCNRFQDPKHRMSWHKDTYGEHICVLTLGSERRIEFRNNKTRRVEALTPASGDLYLMPLRVNKYYKHRVCSAMASWGKSNTCHDVPPEDITRLSFVFFFEPPEYARKEFRISTRDMLVGIVEDFREKTGFW